MPRHKSATKQATTKRPNRTAKAVRHNARAVRRKQPDLQERVFKAFAGQADSLWSGFADQCRQFAEGFNNQLGAPELTVEADATTMRAAYPKGEAELVVTLDRAERYVQCWLKARCGIETCCSPNQLPVGMTVSDDALRFAYAGEVVTDERLAIMLLTQLTNGTL